jgi:hypothetical protein
LAKEIAADLFLDYNGKKADRLEAKFKQEDGTEKPGGGWCEEAVIDRIEEKLKENLFWSLGL